MVPESLSPNRLSDTAAWRLHRFRRASAGENSQRDLEADVCAFFAAVLEEFSGAGRWMLATAPPRGGGIDAWFRLPLAPADPNFSPVWVRLLGSYELTSQAISGRN